MIALSTDTFDIVNIIFLLNFIPFYSSVPTSLLLECSCFCNDVIKLILLTHVCYILWSFVVFFFFCPFRSRDSA